MHPDKRVTIEQSGNTYPWNTSIKYVCPCPEVWNSTNTITLESICTGTTGWTLNDQTLQSLKCVPGERAANELLTHEH